MCLFSVNGNFVFTWYIPFSQKEGVTFQSCWYNISTDTHVARKVADPSSAVLLGSSEAAVLLERCDDQRLTCSYNNGDDLREQMFFPKFCWKITKCIFMFEKDSQCTFKRNIQARSRNHCCRGTSISITYFECVCVCVCSLVYPARTAHAPYFIVIFGPYGSTVFLHIIV